MRALNHLEKTTPADSKPLVRARGRGKVAKYIQPTVDAFKRSKDGSKLIRQELKRILVEQSKMYPHKAMLNSDLTMIKYTGRGGKISQCTMEDFLEKGPAFFSLYFNSIRKKNMYSQKVFDWFQRVSCLSWFYPNGLKRFACAYLKKTS